MALEASTLAMVFNDVSTDEVVLFVGLPAAVAVAIATAAGYFFRQRYRQRSEASAQLAQRDRQAPRE